MTLFDNTGISGGKKGKKIIVNEWSWHVVNDQVTYLWEYTRPGDARTTHYIDNIFMQHILGTIVNTFLTFIASLDNASGQQIFSAYHGNPNVAQTAVTQLFVNLSRPLEVQKGRGLYLLFRESGSAQAGFTFTVNGHSITET